MHGNGGTGSLWKTYRAELLRAMRFGIPKKEAGVDDPHAKGSTDAHVWNRERSLLLGYKNWTEFWKRRLDTGSSSH